MNDNLPSFDCLDTGEHFVSDGCSRVVPGVVDPRVARECDPYAIGAMTVARPWQVGDHCLVSRGTALVWIGDTWERQWIEGGTVRIAKVEIEQVELDYFVANTRRPLKVLVTPDRLSQ